MRNENEFKTIFKRSVKAQGGYALTLAAPMVAGIPDLLIVMPGYALTLIEAKWLGEVGLGFSRKIQYTALQRDILNKANSVNNGVAWGVVGYKFKDKYYCSLARPQLTHVSFGFNSIECAKKLFDVRALFEQHAVPKILEEPK